MNQVVKVSERYNAVVSFSPLLGRRKGGQSLDGPCMRRKP
jgi:hypothetical protein